MEEFTRLVGLMESLRGEQRLPVGQEQTEKSFTTFLLEEVYEIIEAIETEDYQGLKEELGDLLFHIVFLAQICKERDRFDIKDVVVGIYDKMHRRHPHVFSRDADEKPVEKRWEEIKRAEKSRLLPGRPCPEDAPCPASGLHNFKKGCKGRL